MRAVLLFLFYCLVITPFGALGRLVRDPLSRRADPSVTSYWILAERT